MSTKNGPPYGKPQMRVNLGSTEATDTERRAIAWHVDGYMIDSGQLADGATVKRFYRLAAEARAEQIVSAYLNAGGKTASMEARQAHAH